MKTHKNLIRKSVSFLLTLWLLASGIPLNVFVSLKTENKEVLL